MMNDRIQTNARILHPNGAVFGDGKRNAECFFKGDHKRVDYTSRSGCAEELRSEEQMASPFEERWLIVMKLSAAFISE